MDFAGASAIVTGGASGLGAATSRALARAGAHVVVVDTDRDGASAIATEIGGVPVVADVTDATEVTSAVERAVEQGPLRALVACAGITRTARIVDRRGAIFPPEDFELVLRVNLIGTFTCMCLAAQAMRELEPTPSGTRGTILTTSSIAAFDGQVGQAAYTASKAAIAGLTLAAARDLAIHAIRVNTIAPGLFDTPIYGSGDDAEAFKARLGEGVVHPPRLGVPEEFAEMVLAVLANDYMNGEVIRLDGGIRLAPR